MIWELLLKSNTCCMPKPTSTFPWKCEKFRELEDAEMSVLYGHHVHRLEHEHEHHGRI